MIELAKGNLLEAPVEALVNTVNTTGVMGKGIALQFKQAYPGMFRAYERASKAGEVKLGKVQVYDLGGLGGGPHWVMRSNNDARASAVSAVATAHQWNVRKRRNLKTEHLVKAWQRLKEQHWDATFSIA